MDIKRFLEAKTEQYNKKWFVFNDPVSVPHRFQRKEDIEISGFLTATIAWGQRPAILKKANLLMDLMDGAPYNFITQQSELEFARFSTFVYRTFNGVDCQYFISALRQIYLSEGGLEKVFTEGFLQNASVYAALAYFRKVFISYQPMARTGKHLANVEKGSAAKRLNMFLRWLVRDDGIVDFGLWKGIPASSLMMPLDVHVGRVARQMGLLKRRQNDWKAVEELTQNLRCFDANDPVRYDYALFGMGVNGDW
jgi:uncharacterized protein (TIGR02757 family)